MASENPCINAVNAAIATERALWAATDDVALDLRIAERTGDPAAIEAAKQARSKASSDWYAARIAARDAAKTVIATLGIVDPATFASIVSSNL